MLLRSVAVIAATTTGSVPRWDGRSALSYWLAGVEQHARVQVETLRFNDERVEGLVRAIRSDSDEQELFWDRLAHCLIGVSLRDWNDTSEETFKTQLLATKEQVEHEALGLAEEGEVIELQIHLPEAGERTYRFRSSDLSPQGQRILVRALSNNRRAVRSALGI